MFLSKFDLDFIIQKSIKGQFITNQLTEAPLLGNFPLDINLPDEDIFKIDKEEVFVDSNEEFYMTIYFYG